MNVEEFIKHQGGYRSSMVSEDNTQTITELAEGRGPNLKLLTPGELHLSGEQAFSRLRLFKRRERVWRGG
jgi:hypothetical protein